MQKNNGRLKMIMILQSRHSLQPILSFLPIRYVFKIKLLCYYYLYNLKKIIIFRIGISEQRDSQLMGHSGFALKIKSTLSVLSKGSGRMGRMSSLFFVSQP